MEAVCAPFSFEAAHGMLRCHGESIAVPHAEGCTQWLMLVGRRAAYAVRPVLPFGLTLQRCCVVLLCVRKVRYPELEHCTSAGQAVARTSLRAEAQRVGATTVAAPLRSLPTLVARVHVVVSRIQCTCLCLVR